MLLLESTAKITNQFALLLLLFNAKSTDLKLKKNEEGFCKSLKLHSISDSIFRKAQKSSNPTSTAKVRPRNASICSESSKKALKKPKNLPENSPILQNQPQAKARIELPPQIQSILSQPEPVTVTVPPSVSPKIHFPEIGKPENKDNDKNTGSNKAVNER